MATIEQLEARLTELEQRLPPAPTLQANPPVTIGELADVPAPGSPILSAWTQEVSRRVVHRFATTAARDAAYPAGPAGYGALAYTSADKALWTSDGITWTTVQATPWTAINLNAPWTNVGGLAPPPRARRIGDNVQIQMAVTSSSLANIAFLAAAFIPAFTQQLPAIVNQVNFGWVSVVNSGGTLGVVTPATTGRWDINAIYPVS